MTGAEFLAAFWQWLQNFLIKEAPKYLCPLLRICWKIVTIALRFSVLLTFSLAIPYLVILTEQYNSTNPAWSALHFISWSPALYIAIFGIGISSIAMTRHQHFRGSSAFLPLIQLVLIGLAVVLVTNRQPPPSIISGAVAKPFDFVGSDTIFKFSQFCLDDGVEKTLNVLSGELREFLRTNTQYNRLVVEGHTDGRHVSKYRDISNDSSRDLDRLVNESLSRKSMLSNIECNPTTKPMITSNIELGFLRAVSVAIFLRKSLSDLHISVVPASFSSCDLDTENHACGYDSDWQPRQRRVRVIPMILASGSAAG